MNIQTVEFAHILETDDLEALHNFLSHTAFVISHKSESIETLLRVLWYIPINSTIIVVTNCPEKERDDLTRALKTRLADHRKTYVVHQKDEQIARLFQASNVPQILGTDGKVIDGKGEGMYIGALCAYQLGFPRWLIFYDADNFVPSALLEYTLAMCRLFTSTPLPVHTRDYDTLIVQRETRQPATSDLHNVRICWSSKPDMHNTDWETRIMGRTTRVVSPLFDSLLKEWFGIYDHPISSSNAGEQGMTVETAASLRFSSGFSVETFQLLDLFFNATTWKTYPQEIIFQQYLSKSPHFHEKKDEEHIKKMIAESLGCFFHFAAALPAAVKVQLQQIYDELHLERVEPTIYPRLQDLPLGRFGASMEQYALFPQITYQDLLTAEAVNQDLVPVDASCPEILATGPVCQDMLIADTNRAEIPVADTHYQDLLAANTNYQDFFVADQDFFVAD